MKAPVVLLAFANDQNEYLDQLDQEMEHLRSMLFDWDQKALINLQVLKRASLKDIYTAISTFKDQLAIFHYGGHATGTQLILEDEKANADGLAQLLKEQAKAQLQLVFLNGCSTRDQVEKLHAFGIPAVIATSVSVPDNQAVLFSARFYESLANLHTIRQAFDQAAGYVNASASLSEKIGRQVETFRGLSGIAQKAESELPWGFYLNPAGDANWDWKLPQFKSQTQQAGAVYHTGHYTPNQHIPDILEEMVKHKRAIQREMYDDEDEPIDRSDYPDLVIKHFPSPIGIQIQKLVASETGDPMSQAGLPRLQQILSTYMATTQLVAYILVSEFWEGKRDRSLSPQQYELNKPLEKFISRSREEVLSFNYLEAIRQISANFQSNNITPFIQEFAADKHNEPLFFCINNPQDEFVRAANLLEDLKQSLAGNSIPDQEIENICNGAEQALVHVLKRLSFLAKYKMLTVRDVEMYRPRFYDMQYQHRYANLNLSTNNHIALKQQRILSNEPSDSGSVVLVYTTREIDNFLNLSPFVIDRYAFDSQSESHIYLFSHAASGEYVFIRSTSDMYKAITEADDQLSTRDPGNDQIQLNYMELLKSQFNMFYSDLIKHKVVGNG